MNTNTTVTDSYVAKAPPSASKLPSGPATVPGAPPRVTPEIDPDGPEGGGGRLRARGQARPLFESKIVWRAIGDSFRKLDPRHQVRNPVMFVVEVGSVMTTGLFVQALVGKGEAPAWFILAVSLWLWFTVLFANFAEAMAEGRGKAQADSLRKARKDIHAKKLAEALRGAKQSAVVASELRKGDHVLVEAGDYVPCDGEIVEGVASRWTRARSRGRAPPVIRESGAWRPERGHRRDSPPLRRAHRPHLGQPRGELSRPDDLHGRGSRSVRRRPTRSRSTSFSRRSTIIFLLATAP